MTYVMIMLIALSTGEVKRVAVETDDKKACLNLGEMLSEEFAKRQEVDEVEYDCIPLRKV